MRRAIERVETGEGVPEIELRIGQFRPAPQRQPVLNFFTTPALNIAHNLFWCCAIDAAQISDVIGSVIFNQRGGLHRREHDGIDLRPIEAGPLNIIQRPARFVHGAIGHSRLPQLAPPMFSKEVANEVEKPSPAPNSSWLLARVSP